MRIRMHLLLAGVVLGWAGPAAGQVQMHQSTRDRLQNNYFNPDYSDFFVYGVDNRPANVRGDVYLDTTFRTGRVLFYPTEIRRNGKTFRLDSLVNVPMRLDLKNNELELSTPFGTKVVPGDLVREFAWQQVPGLPQNAAYANTGEFSGKVPERGGFYQVLAAGELSLLLHHKLIVKGPTYNVALNVGSQDTEIIKEKHFYYARGKEVAKLSRSRATLLKLMADKKEQIETYLAARQIDYRSAGDLGQLFAYYNSL